MTGLEQERSAGKFGGGSQDWVRRPQEARAGGNVKVLGGMGAGEGQKAWRLEGLKGGRKLYDKGHSAPQGQPQGQLFLRGIQDKGR